MKKSDIYKYSEILVKKTKEAVDITDVPQTATYDRALKKALSLYLDTELDSVLSQSEILYKEKYILPLKSTTSNDISKIKLCPKETNLNIISVIFFAVHLSNSYDPYYDFRSKKGFRFSLDGDDWVESLRIDCQNVMNFYYNESLIAFKEKHSEENKTDYARKQDKFKSNLTRKVSLINDELINLLSISFKLTLLHDSQKKNAIKEVVSILSETLEKIDTLTIDDQYYFTVHNINLIKKLNESIKLIENKIKSDAKKTKEKYRNGVTSLGNEDGKILAKEFNLSMMQSTDYAKIIDPRDTHTIDYLKKYNIPVNVRISKVNQYINRPDGNSSSIKDYKFKEIRIKVPK